VQKNTEQAKRWSDSGDTGSSHRVCPKHSRGFALQAAAASHPKHKFPREELVPRKGKMQKFSVISGYGFESSSAKLRRKGEYFKDGMGSGKPCLGRP